MVIPFKVGPSGKPDKLMPGTKPGSTAGTGLGTPLSPPKSLNWMRLKRSV